VLESFAAPKVNIRSKKGKKGGWRAKENVLAWYQIEESASQGGLDQLVLKG